MKNALPWVTFLQSFLAWTLIYPPLANAGACVGQGMEPRISNIVQGT